MRTYRATVSSWSRPCWRDWWVGACHAFWRAGEPAPPHHLRHRLLPFLPLCWDPEWRYWCSRDRDLSTPCGGTAWRACCRSPAASSGAAFFRAADLADPGTFCLAEWEVRVATAWADSFAWRDSCKCTTHSSAAALVACLVAICERCSSPRESLGYLGPIPSASPCSSNPEIRLYLNSVHMSTGDWYPPVTSWTCCPLPWDSAMACRPDPPCPRALCRTRRRTDKKGLVKLGFRGRNKCRSPAFRVWLAGASSEWPAFPAKDIAAHSRWPRSSPEAASPCTEERACIAILCPHGLYCETTLKDVLSARCEGSHRWRFWPHWHQLPLRACAESPARKSLRCCSWDHFPAGDGSSGRGPVGHPAAEQAGRGGGGDGRRPAGCCGTSSASRRSRCSDTAAVDSFGEHWSAAHSNYWSRIYIIREGFKSPYHCGRRVKASGCDVLASHLYVGCPTTRSTPGTMLVKQVVVLGKRTLLVLNELIFNLFQ